MKLNHAKSLLLGTGALSLSIASMHVSAVSLTNLQGRDLDGNASTIEAYYDTAQDITWLADANAAGVTMDWTSANTWAAGLNIGGVTGWRLPSVTDTGVSGCAARAYSGTDCGWNVDLASGEMAHMFYSALGGVARYDQSGTQLSTGFGLVGGTAPFSGLLSAPYWSSTAYAPDTSKAWYFDFTGGFQGEQDVTASYSAWAVHAGDVGSAVVPVPAAIWLFVSGLLGLFGYSAKRRR